MEPLACAGCGREFDRATAAQTGQSKAFTAGMQCVCVYCGSLIYVVSPGESRLLGEEDDIQQELIDLAVEIVYGQ